MFFVLSFNYCWQIDMVFFYAFMSCVLLINFLRKSLSIGGSIATSSFWYPKETTEPSSFSSLVPLRNPLSGVVEP